MHAADAPLWLQHSPAALGRNQSSLVFLRVFLFLFWLVEVEEEEEEGGCHHFQQQRGCLSAGSSRRLDEEVGERCHNGDERIEKSATDFLHVAVCLALRQRKGCGYGM